MRPFFILLILLSSLEALAGLKIFLWDSGQTLVPLVLFVRDGEPPEAAAQRYLSNLERDPGMMELFGGRSPYLPLQGFREASDMELRNSVLLMANDPKDYTEKSVRTQKFMATFEQAQARALILPMMPGVGLDGKANRELRQLIANKFPILVAMGGDDVEPALYNKEKTLAKETIESRDRSESLIIRDYVRAEKGFIMGICRGHQITSVTLGYQLIQDVPLLVDNALPHAKNFHEIQLFITDNNILRRIFPEGRIRVNSYHHQAVQYKPTGPLQLAAVGDDGIVEALEFKDGRGLLLQFHPEDMDNSVGRSIIDTVVETGRSRSIYSCRKVHRL